ncbi:MarR family transcriptional regulator [Methanothrix soehngenii]|uniref:MarR family transcriptional regulator n=1 Tax=Methanothrix soehngenii TaxID=2223 RepID=UPI002FE19C2D
MVFAGASHSPHNPNLDRLPASARRIAELLESESLLTQKEIVTKTYLPARTVRYALNRLKEENLLLERFSFRDARQSLYSLNLEGSISEVVTS